MKQPPMFRRLLRDWITMPRVIDDGVTAGFAGKEPQPGWVPLKGLSAISDVLPPKAWAYRGFADVYNKEIRKFRRRVALSAFVAGISKADLEAQLEVHAMFVAALNRRILS